MNTLNEIELIRTALRALSTIKEYQLTPYQEITRSKLIAKLKLLENEIEIVDSFSKFNDK